MAKSCPLKLRQSPLPTQGASRACGGTARRGTGLSAGLKHEAALWAERWRRSLTPPGTHPRARANTRICAPTHPNTSGSSRAGPGWAGPAPRPAAPRRTAPTRGRHDPAFGRARPRRRPAPAAPLSAALRAPAAARPDPHRPPPPSLPAGFRPCAVFRGERDCSLCRAGVSLRWSLWACPAATVRAVQGGASS